MRDGWRVVAVAATAAVAAGCGVSEPLTCDTIEAQGGVCGDTWDCVRLLDSPVLTETQDAGLVQLYLPGLQTCLDSSFHVYGTEGTTDDDIYAAFGEDKLAEARQACVDKCEQALSSTVLTDDEVKGMCATYVGDPYYHSWWLEVDGPEFESRPCRYEGNAQSAPPSSAPVSLVVSTPSGSAEASGWVRFTLPVCTRSWCKVELERLDLTLDGPLRYAVPGGAVETIEEGTITLTSGASGTALGGSSVYAVTAADVHGTLVGRSYTAGKFAFELDGAMLDRPSLSFTVPAGGAPALNLSFTAGGVAVTVAPAPPPPAGAPTERWR